MASLLLVWLTLSAAPLGACTVPVFQYALDRWAAEPYRLAVLHAAPLSAEQQAAVNWLRENAARLDANCRIREIDLAGGPEALEQYRWAAPLATELPVLAVSYPPSSKAEHAPWSTDLTLAGAKVLLDSPARRAIAQRLLDGEAGVWILVECGRRARDDAAACVLQAEITRLEHALIRPVEDQFADSAGPSEPENMFRPRFSLVRVSRSDPAEASLVAMLLGSEPDLHDYPDQPLAFPVFGRGRALYALVGAGINADTIEDACTFLSGPCACVVKWRNPGTDLLMAVDWESALAGRPMPEATPPPLTSLAAFADSSLEQVAPAGLSETDTPDGRERPARRVGLLGRSLGAVLALGVVAVAASTLILKRKNR